MWKFRQLIDGRTIGSGPIFTLELGPKSSLFSYEMLFPAAPSAVNCVSTALEAGLTFFHECGHALLKIGTARATRKGLQFILHLGFDRRGE